MRDRLPPVLRHGPAFWRRSVQARVVVSTVLLSAAVVGIVGWFLMQQTRDGLLDHRVEAVVQEAEGETAAARAALAATPGIDADESAQQQALVEPISGARDHARLRRGAVPADRRRASGWPTAARSSPRASTWPACRSPSRPRFDSLSADGVDLHRHPAPRGRSRASPRAPASWSAARSGSRPTTTPTRSTTSTRWPRSEETLALVSRALLVAGVPLLLLVALLTWLVTRQVVTPIRMARRVAERLAAGQLAGAPARHRRGRPGAARDVVQPDGLQPPEADPPARGAQPAPAPLRLRRLPRAAHAHHHRADGQRRHPRRQAVPRPGHRVARPSCSRRSSTASRRSSPTCSRSAASTPGPRCSRPRTSTSSTSPAASST